MTINLDYEQKEGKIKLEMGKKRTKINIVYRVPKRERKGLLEHLDKNVKDGVDIWNKAGSVELTLAQYLIDRGIIPKEYVEEVMYEAETLCGYPC